MNDSTPATRPIPVLLAVTLTALVHPEPTTGGYSAEVPALRGCYTEGESLEEVQANLREAAEAWLGAAHDRATPVRGKEGAA